MTDPFDTASVAAALQEGDRRALARALTWIENHAEDAATFVAALPDRAAPRIGVTGPPGAGKSTLVSAMTAAWRAQELTVGVLAVDPTSPVTGGALLGDRVRMHRHAGDDGVFVRSLATRGEAGGLARAVAYAARILSAAGFDRVVIETVGVGQTEVDVAHVADLTLLVVAPGSGDAVQGMKAGPLELADAIVVNQADRDGVDGLVAALTSALELADRPAPPVHRTVATRDEGVAEVVAWVDAQLAAGPGTPDPARVRARLRKAVERAVVQRFWAASRAEFEDALLAVLENRTTLEGAVARLTQEDPA